MRSGVSVAHAARMGAALALLAAAPPAAAFTRDTTGFDPRAGTCLWWAARGATYHVNAAGAAGTGCTAPEAAVAAAFAAWAGATRDGDPSPCTDLTFAAGASTDEKAVARDGVNLVVFRGSRCEPGQDPATHNCWSHDLGTIGLTTTWFDSRTGQILEADMELFAWTGTSGWYFTCADPGDPSCTPPFTGQTGCNEVDVQAVVTHEAGHVLGLDHVCTDEWGAAQYVCPPGPPVMSPSTGSVSQRGLAADDVEGVCTIYPKGAATLACAPLDEPSAAGGCSSGGGLGALGGAFALAALRLLRRRR